MENLTASVLWYLLKASAFLLVFAIGYYYLFRNSSHYTFLRLYIMGALFLALLMPMIKAPITYTPLDFVSGYLVSELPEIIVVADAEEALGNMIPATNQNNKSLWLSLFFLFSGFFLIRFLFRLYRIVRLRGKVYPLQMGVGRVFFIPNLQNSFSFFSWIFIDASLQNSMYFDKIFLHEKAHLQKFHSLDIVCFELMQSIFWFHPVFYYLKKEIRNLHEFEADAMALQTIPKIDYQKALLDIVMQKCYYPLAHSFNVSLIKKRILMMNQNSKTHYSQLWLRSFLILPFIAALLFVQSCEGESAKEQQVELIAEKEEKAESAIEIEGEIYTVPDEVPQFPGGDEARMKFLQKELKYPTLARELKMHGTVFCSFVVSSRGQIAQEQILRGIAAPSDISDAVYQDILSRWEEICPSNPKPSNKTEMAEMASSLFDEEVLRVVSLMPDFTPGTLNGEPVNVQFTLPISFRVN